MTSAVFRKVASLTAVVAVGVMLGGAPVGCGEDPAKKFGGGDPSGTGGADDPGSGGSGNSGGSGGRSAGGAPARTGGRSGSGGATGSGGAAAAGGGASASGGRSGTGGASSSSGGSGSGGGVGSGGDVGTGGNPGTGGSTGTECAAIAAAYRDEMPKAKACSAVAGACKHAVSAALGCGSECITYVNDPTELNKFANLWREASCQARNCQPVLCNAVSGGKCVTSGLNLQGTCMDTAAAL